MTHELEPLIDHANDIDKERPIVHPEFSTVETIPQPPLKAVRMYRLNEEKLKQAIEGILDSLVKWDEDAVKAWIAKKWPHGIGLFE